MKRTLLALITLAVSLSLATGALAAKKGTVPSSLCFSDGDDYHYILAIKLTGNVNTSEGPVGFYTINGDKYLGSSSLPLIGSGFLKGGTFHFTLTGTTYWSGHLYTELFEGYWTVATASGTYAQRQIINDTGWTQVHTGNLTAVDCREATIPFNAQGE